jgi:hypothetical protein
MTRTIRIICLPFQVLLGAALLRPVAGIAQGSRPVVTLDRGGAPQSPNYVRAQGEYSYANGPANFYAFSPAHVGKPAPLEAVTLRFSAPTTITKIESTNDDFVVEDGGSCMAGNSFSKGDTCIVLMRFTPLGPGRRLGGLTVSHTASAEPASIGLGGNGYAPAISFVPAATSTIAATLSGSTGVLKSAQNLTVAGDVLYIPDTGNDLLREIDASGTLTNVTPEYGAPASVAVDSFGDVWAINVEPPSSRACCNLAYYRPWEQFVWNVGYTGDGPICTASAPCSLENTGLFDPANIIIDSDNNLFMEEGSEGALEMPVGGLLALLNPDPNLWWLTDEAVFYGPGQAAFAVNASDYLFTSFTDISETPSFCAIVEEPLYGAETSNPNYIRVAGGDKCGYAGDGGQATNAEIGSSFGQIAFDLAGDLYFTDTANERVRMINVNTGIITTVLGTGANAFTDASGNRSTMVNLSNPTGVAVDSQGQIYVITDAPSGSSTEVVQKVSATGYLPFPNTTQGATSAAQIATATNTGNSTMILTNYAFTGPHPGDFSIDPTTTSCPLTGGSTLDPGQSCKIGVLFKPAATGARSADLRLLDNTVTNTNTIELIGVGEAATADFALVPGSVTFPATAPTLSNTIPLTVTNKGNVDLKIDSIALGGADADAFSVTGNCADGSIAPGAACNLKVTFKPSSDGRYSATIRFNDNAPDSPQSVSIEGSGVKPFTSATKLTSAANPAPACAAVQFHISVSTSDGTSATGPVSLHLGTLTVASGTLHEGAATLTVEGLAPGVNILTASYGGDTEHDGSTSAALLQKIDHGSCSVFRPLHSVHDAPVADRP